MHSLTRAVVVAALLLSGASVAHAAPQPAWTPRPATFGVVIDRDVPVRMDDGVYLRADIHRPAINGLAAPGRFPVLVSQTAYNKAIPVTNMADDYMVERGYVQVILDVRGTGDSPGNWDSFGPREQRDGYDIVEWAASPQQPWSDGNVGLDGASYAGINQIFTAAQQPPGLKAIFPVVPAGDVYRDVAGNGGQIDIGFMPLWLALVGSTSLLPPLYSATDPGLALNVLGQHLQNANAFNAGMILNALAGGDMAFAGPFYQQRSTLRVIDKVTVPTFIVGGENDLFQRSEPTLYQHLAANGVPAKFLYGPWTHAQAGVPALDIPFLTIPNPQPGNSLPELKLRWYDHYVQGIPDQGIVDRAPVTYYENGGNWRTAAQWPPAGVHYEKLSLSGRADSDGHVGTLSANNTGTPGPDTAYSKPLAGACSESSDQWTAGLVGLLDNACDVDQSANDRNGLTYNMPVTTPLRLTGPMSAHLTVSTPATDGQLTARLEDVAPNGQVRQISAGWQVLSLRQLDPAKSTYANGLMVTPYHPYTQESAQPMPANQPVPVDIEIFPNAAIIQPGHTLRLAIQTGDFPHLAAPSPQQANTGNASIQVWHDATHPSWIVLPTTS